MNMPLAMDAEKALLGHMLADNERYHLAAGITSGDFAGEAHRRIYGAIAELIESGESTDLFTVQQRLSQRKELNTVGGAAYLASLTDNVVLASSLSSLVQLVREASRRRQLIRICEAISLGAEDRDRTSSELLGDLQEQLWTMQADDSVNETRHIGPVIKEAFHELEAIRTRSGTLLGCTYGLHNLDTETTGLRPGELVILAGRPGEGKSCLATQCALENAKAGIPVGIFAVEMSDRQTATRMSVQDGRVDAWKVRKAYLSNEELETYREDSVDLARLPIYINDASSLNVRDFDARARLMVKRHGVKLIIVDHIHEMTAPGHDERQCVTRIAEALRQFAKTTQVPVLAVAQMPRPRDGNLRTRPTKYDLKESGALEQKAHCVLLIYRGLEENGRHSGEDEVIIAKQREGPTGSQPVTFNPKRLRFEVRQAT